MSAKRTPNEASLPYMPPIVSPQKKPAAKKSKTTHDDNNKKSATCIFIGDPTPQMTKIRDVFYQDPSIYDTIMPFTSILPDIQGIRQDVQDNIISFEDLFADTGVVITDSNKPVPFSGVVEPAFGHALRNMGVHRLNNWSDFLTLTGARLEPNTSRNTLIFTITPTVDKKVTANINHNNVPEIWVRPNNVYEYNPKFWRSTIDNYGATQANRKYALNLAIKIPEWALSKKEATENSHAVEWMRTVGPGFEGAVHPWVYTTLWGGCAQALAHYATTSVWQKARMAGFSPILVGKNMILQSPQSQQRKSKFGIRGYQIATTDTEPKTYIALAGFYKPNPEDPNDPQIVALRIDNKFLASTAMTQAHD